MRVRHRLADNVNYIMAARDERIRNEASVTAPWHCLGAENSRGSLLAKGDESLERCTELRAVHVVRIAPKRSVSPGGVRRIPARRAPATEVRLVDIGDARLRQ